MTDGPQAILPPALLSYSYADVCSQRIAWRPTDMWHQALAQHDALLWTLVDEVIDHGGIRRSFVHEKALGDPVELFLATMAWGLGRRSRAIHHQRNLLVGATAVVTDQAARKKLARIVNDTQKRGAGAGWHSLLVSNKITGLEMSFGTKLLYFAGYSLDLEGPRPLILDDNARGALHRLRPDVMTDRGKVDEARYLAYLEQAERWAAVPSWNQTADTVEYGLFRLGQAE
jgi:hypothetical protein